MSSAELTLTFNEALDSDSVPSPNQFSVTVNGTAVDLAAAGAVVISGSDVILTLAAAVGHGDVVNVSYAGPTVPTDKPIQDAAGNDAGAFTLDATNTTPDIIPPGQPKAEVNGNKLTLTFDEALDPDSVPSPDQFTVTVNGTAVDLAAAGAVVISGSDVILTLAAAVGHGNVVNVSYAIPTGPNDKPIQDEAGNDAGAFTTTVINTTSVIDSPTIDTTAPELMVAEVNGSKLTLTFNEALDSDSVPNPDQFTVTVNGTAVDLAAAGAVVVSGSDVILTLAAAVGHGDVVNVSYAGPTGPTDKPIQDAAGNKAKPLTRPATNTTESPAIVPPFPDPPHLFRLTITLALPSSTETDGTPIDSDTLKVYRVTGHEAISQPFRYAIDLLRVDAGNNPLPLASGDVLDKNATLGIAVDDGDGSGNSPMVRNVHGVIEEFIVDEYLPPTNTDTEPRNRYRLVLVPRLAWLARNRQNRIHATSDPQSLERIVSNKLLSRGTDYSTADSGSRIVLEESDFRIDIDNDKLPLDELSHVTQYNETDLDFVQRLCEHHGVYFFFASNTADSNGMVVFANTNSPFGVIRFESDPDHTTPTTPTAYEEKHKLEIKLTLTGTTGLLGGSQYSEPTDDEAAKLAGVMSSFKSVHRPVPAYVRVIDDNGSGRGADLRETVEFDPRTDGIHTSDGIYTDYDTHFPDSTTGSAFATIRSQERKAAHKYYIAVTNSPCLAPGRTFTKGSDPTTDPNFLVTEVDIDITQDHPGINPGIDRFTNCFRCIDFDDAAAFVFRPPRVTPIPRLPGVHTAYIATGSDDPSRPEPDSQGAYRVYHKHAEERTSLSIDSRSMAVRKAEPYAGHGVGMHFPLKEDTEVLLVYRNGHPDRPVIAAAMPGEGGHDSPVTGANPTSHVVETSSGARFEIHDDTVDDRARVTLRSRKNSERASYLRLGKADVTDPGSAAYPSTLEDHYVDTVFSDHKDKENGIALLTADNIRVTTKKDKFTEAQKSVYTRAGDDIEARSVQKHLLQGRRMVIFSGLEEDEPTDDTNAASDGSPDTIDDDDTLIYSSGGIYLKSRNDIHLTAKGASIIEVEDTARQVFRHDLHTHVFADEHYLVAGSSSSLTQGASTSLGLGLGFSATMGGFTYFTVPLAGYICFGVGYLKRPEILVNHLVVTIETTEGTVYEHCTSDNESSALSIKTQAVRFIKTQVQARIENLIADCVGIDITL